MLLTFSGAEGCANTYTMEFSTDWIITIVASLLGGLNVFQFICWRSEKKKHEAEAASAELDAKQKSMDLSQDQFDYLLNKLTDYQRDYFKLADQLKDEAQRHANEMAETTKKFSIIINDKCNEIAELKSKIIYFKNLRCYKTDCPYRMGTNPDSKNNKN